MKILFFTPHVALWEHTVPEAYLAKGLSELGHDVEYMTCGRAQSYCAPMSAHGHKPSCSADSIRPICDACEAGVKSLHSSYGFPTFNLAQYITSADRAACEVLAKQAYEQKTLYTQSHGIEVGRLTLYEFTLAHKKMSTVLTESEWAEYRIYLLNALISLRAFARFLEQATPEVIVAFSPQYSNINPCMQFAIRRGIKAFFMESGTNLSHRLGTMRVWDWQSHRLVNPALKYWGRSELNVVTEEAARAVSGHFEQLLSGKHFAVFSSPYAGHGGDVGIRSKWAIRSEQKVLLMTLSSYDEAYAAFLIDAFPENKVFSNVYRTQAEWVRATIAWVKQRPDLFLVIRVHPRDFPNKREQARSEQSFMLEDLLENVPENVHVNWPCEGIALYELLEDTSVILTGWSITAMEGLILGIPVVTYDRRLPSYPPDIMRTGSSEDEYLRNIEAALEAGWSMDNVVNGFRWLAYNFVTSTVVASRRFGRHELANRGLVERILWRIRKKLPRLARPLELLGWRDAKPGAEIIDAMLRQGYDSIPAVRAQSRRPQVADADKEIVKRELRHLHELLYSGSQLPDDKPGLSKNIRSHLNMESNA